jgi:predicted permease
VTARGPRIPAGRPPRFARWLLRLVPLGGLRDEVEQDLDELFAARCQARGARYGRRRYYGDVLSLWRHPRQAQAPEAAPRSRAAEVGQDLTYAIRLLRRNPTVVAITVAGLGLAIGVSTSVFSVVNAVAFRPVGIHEAGTAVRVFRAYQHGTSTSWPYAEFLRLRDASPLVTLEASMPDSAWFSRTPDAGDSESIGGAFVSGGYLATLSRRPAYGRLLAPEDDVVGAAPVVVISHRFWTRRLGADPSIAGRAVWLNGVRFTVAGVSAPGFTGIDDRTPAFWAPFASHRAVSGGRAFDRQSSIGVSVIGRVKPGVEPARAEAILNAVASAIGSDGADTGVERLTGARVRPAGDRFSPADVRAIALVAGTVSAAVGLVLLLACVNVANLLLASALSRQREIGVRLALGASRGRLVRQLLTESLSLGLAGGGLGLVFTLWLVPVLVTFARAPIDLAAAPDARVYLFLTVVSILAGVGAGLAPARHAMRDQFASPLKGGAPLDAGGRPRRMRSALIGAQAGASLVLLVLAALLTRAMVRATQVDIGFEPDRLLIASPSFGRGADPHAAAAYWELALERVRALPGVTSASLATQPPFGQGGSEVTIIRRGWSRSTIYHNRTHADYFTTLGLRIVRGRAYTPGEVAAGAPVAVISEAMARDYFPGEDPLGKSLSRVVGQSDDVIVGVASNAITARLRELGAATLYKPLRDPGSARLIIRTQGPPEALTPLVRNALQPLNPRLGLDIRPVAAGLQEQLAEPRILATLAGVLAAIALALAVLGIYGVTAFVVGQRTQEISVRLALGADRAGICRLLLHDSLRPVVAGLGCGIFAAFLGSRLFAGVLYGIGPADPIAFGVSLLVLMTAAIAAVLHPARRASRLDPASVLREL